MPNIRTASDVLQKTASEVVIVNLDYDDLLSTGETLSTIVSVTVDPTGELTIDSSAVSGTKLQLTLSAGVVDTEYTLTGTVTTSEGQTLEGVGKMLVQDP